MYATSIIWLGESVSNCLFSPPGSVHGASCSGGGCLCRHAALAVHKQSTSALCVIGEVLIPRVKDLGSRVSGPGSLPPTPTFLPNPSPCDPVTYIPEALLAGTQGDQLYDVICVCIHLAAVALLRRLNAGAMYFWIKDLTHEFLKLSIIYSSVEIMDKVTLASQLIGTIT